MLSASAADNSRFAPGKQGELLGVDANSIAIDPADPETAYSVSRVGVFKTTNGGRSLVSCRASTACACRRLQLTRMTQPLCMQEHSANGIYKSSDHGASWSAMNLGLGNLVILSVAIDPNVSSTIYLGTNGGTLQEH